jgi:hypothetical protein
MAILDLQGMAVPSDEANGTPTTRRSHGSWHCGGGSRLSLLLC